MKLAHFCQDKHQPIQRNDSLSEICPLCRANTTIAKLEQELLRLKQDHDATWTISFCTWKG